MKAHEVVGGLCFHARGIPPRATSLEQLGFVEAVARLRERIVMGLADSADGRINAYFDQAVGESL